MKVENFYKTRHDLIEKLLFLLRVLAREFVIFNGSLLRFLLGREKQIIGFDFESLNLSLIILNLLCSGTQSETNMLFKVRFVSKELRTKHFKMKRVNPPLSPLYTDRRVP
jgi:hypothetical protein